MRVLQETRNVIRKKERWPNLRMSICVTLILLIGAVVVPIPLRAGERCGGFTAKLIVDGRMRDTFPTPTEAAMPADNVTKGAVLQVEGTHARFDVDLDTFTVKNYLLKDGSAPHSGACRQSEIFLDAFPESSNRVNGDLHLRLSSAVPHLVIARGTGPKSKRIDASDCTTGGIFLSVGDSLRFKLKSGG